MGSVTRFGSVASRSILFTIRARRMGSRQLCIRTSRMGSVTALVASLQPLHLVHHPREADGVSAVVYKDEPDGVGYCFGSVAYRSILFTIRRGGWGLDGCV